jgi:hypothetical protein
MATAIFHSLRGETSALILVKTNSLEFSSSPAYVPRDGIEEYSGKPAKDMEQGEKFQIPDGYRLVDFPDPETGKPRTTKDGEHLKVLAY